MDTLVLYYYKIKLDDVSKATVTTEMRGEPCNFCEFSSSRYGCGSEQDQDNDNESELREKVEQLRSLLMKMTGKDDNTSFTELQAFESRLMDVRRIVLDQKKKKELEEEDEQKKKAEIVVDDGTRKKVSVPSKSSSTSSTENRQEKQECQKKRKEKQNNGACSLQSKVESQWKRAFERVKSESLQRKFERLWLYNERMNGREIEGMTSHDLLLLGNEIEEALLGLLNQMNTPLREQHARKMKMFGSVK